MKMRIKLNWPKFSDFVVTTYSIDDETRDAIHNIMQFTGFNVNETIKRSVESYRFLLHEEDVLKRKIQTTDQNGEKIKNWTVT